MFKDILYLVTDYCELPRKGIADYNGVPHYFVSLFDDNSNDWSDIFMLFKIDNHLFDLSLIAWAIERRFSVSKIEEDIQYNRISALPEEKNKLNSIINHIETKISINPHAAAYVYGKFHLLEPKTNYNLAFVNWVKLPRTSDLKIFFDKSTWRFRKLGESFSGSTEGDYF